MISLKQILQTGEHRWVMLLCGILMIPFGILVVASFTTYNGSLLTLAVFHASYTLLLATAFPRPRSYFYTYFAIFLFLGFWPKVVVQTIWAVGFIDPVGDFSGKPAEWDAALEAAISAAVGLIVARLAHLSFSRNNLKKPRETAPTPPVWYVQYRRWVWAATLCIVILLNGLNLHYSFFQIGVNPKLILPFKLNVPIAWLINVGFAFWIASLVHWEKQFDKTTLKTTLLAPIVEAFFSSVCSLSRLTYLLHTVPYWIAFWEKWEGLRNQISKRAIYSLIFAFSIFFILSVYAVFWLRINTYYYVPPEDSVTRQTHRTIAYQLPHLFIQRWVGLEGTLVVGAAPDRGMERLAEVITTNPKLGIHSLYQRLAKVHFLSENPEKFTFLANTGIVAILLFSGSLAVVLFGMALIAALMIAVEACITRFLANDFLRSIAGASLANVIAQTTFPYLTLIFFLQLCVAIAFLAWLQWMKIPNLSAIVARKNM